MSEKLIQRNIISSGRMEVLARFLVNSKLSHLMVMDKKKIALRKTTGKHALYHSFLHKIFIFLKYFQILIELFINSVINLAPNAIFKQLELYIWNTNVIGTVVPIGKFTNTD